MMLEDYPLSLFPPLNGVAKLLPPRLLGEQPHSSHCERYRNTSDIFAFIAMDKQAVEVSD